MDLSPGVSDPSRGGPERDPFWAHFGAIWDPSAGPRNTLFWTYFSLVALILTPKKGSPFWPISAIFGLFWTPFGPYFGPYFGSILGLFWAISGPPIPRGPRTRIPVPGAQTPLRGCPFGPHFDPILGPFWDPPGDLLGTPKPAIWPHLASTRHIWSPKGVHFRTPDWPIWAILDLFWTTFGPYFGSILGPFWVIFGPIQTIPRVIPVA